MKEMNRQTQGQRETETESYTHPSKKEQFLQNDGYI